MEIKTPKDNEILSEVETRWAGDALIVKMQPWVNEIRAWADGHNPENIQSILLRFREQILKLGKDAVAKSQEE